MSLRLLIVYQLEPGGSGLGCGAYPPTMAGGELPIGSVSPGLGGHGEGLRRSRRRCRRGRARCLIRRLSISERGNRPLLFPVLPSARGSGVGIGVTPAEGAGGAESP